MLTGGFGCLVPSVRSLTLALGGPGAGGGKIQLISLLCVNTEEEKEIKFLTPGCGMCYSTAHGVREMGQSRRQGSVFGTAGSPPVTWFCCHVCSAGFGSAHAQKLPIFKSSCIPKLEAPLVVVFKIAWMDLLFMPLFCDDLFRSLLQSEIPFAVARWFSSWGRLIC